MSNRREVDALSKIKGWESWRGCGKKLKKKEELSEQIAEYCAKNS
jgi:hypothetical protein